MAKKKVVLAYSGGLDTSAVIPWLKENIDCEVIAFVGDVGQGEEDLTGIEKKAIDSGASACRILDLKREFVADFIYPCLMAGITYEGKYLLGTSIARPLLAKGQVQVAREFGADALAHGCTGKGNDQVRFESTFAALAPDLEVIAPWRHWNLRSREDLLNYLAERKIPTTASAKKIYSRDGNLWHLSHEGGALENPANTPPDDVWMLTVDPRQAPNEHQDVAIDFEAGRPVAVDGEKLAPEQLITHLNKLAAKHGVGRVDVLENRLVGMKSRGVYETPGGTILVEAYQGIEQCVLDRETKHWKQEMSVRFAELVYNGRWYTPLREALSTCAEKIAERCTGRAVVRLFKGSANLVARSSPHSLYEESYATFSADEVYNQKHAEGFIRLLSLPERIAALKFGPNGGRPY
ncbi:MAG: argininosuccinate synthase [Phycisphaerales bacterium]|nr:argininosuccinate synthase [Phycisphaerales bacterium]